MPNVAPQEVYDMAQYIKSVYATYESMEDAITLGVYKKGSNPKVDMAIEAKPLIDNFFKQGINQKVDLQTSWNQLKELYNKIKQMEVAL